MVSNSNNPSPLPDRDNPSPFSFGVRFDFKGPQQPGTFAMPDACGYVTSMLSQTLLPTFHRSQKLLGDKQLSIAISIPRDHSGVTIDLCLPVENPECLPKLSLADSRTIDTAVTVSNAIVDHLANQGLLGVAHHVLNLKLHATDPNSILPAASLGCNIGISSFKEPAGGSTFKDFRFWDPIGSEWMTMNDADQFVERIRQGMELWTNFNQPIPEVLFAITRRSYDLGLLEDQEVQAAAARILSRSPDKEDHAIAKSLATELLCEGYEGDDLTDIATGS